MTVDEQLQLLKDKGVYDEWFEEFTRVLLTTMNYPIPKTVLDQFYWGGTPQGTDYWGSVNPRVFACEKITPYALALRLNITPETHPEYFI